MYHDALLRFSGDLATPPVPQTITVETRSTNHLDLTATPRWIGDGHPVKLVTTITEALNSATENATIEVQLISLPVLPSTITAALTLPAFNATSDVDDTTETITSTAHGLTNGTRVTVAVTSGLILTGLAVNTNYYIRNATANTFQLSLTPGGAAVGLTDAVGTNTVTFYPTILGSSGAIGIDRLFVGSQIPVTLNSTIATTPAASGGINRYVFARFIPSATLTAGKVLADLMLDSATPSLYAASGIATS